MQDIYKVLSISKWSMKADNGSDMAGAKITVLGSEVRDSRFCGFQVLTFSAPYELYDNLVRSFVPMNEYLLKLTATMKDGKPVLKVIDAQPAVQSARAASAPK